MAELQLHNLHSTSHKKSRRIGRGSGSGRGSYSGRGIKGQKARSGGKGGLVRRALKIQLRSKPKLGGFKSLRPKKVTVNVAALDRWFNAGELVTPKKLMEKGLIESSYAGVKILGDGGLKKKLTVSAHAFSESAKKAILEAGGRTQIIGSASTPKK